MTRRLLSRLGAALSVLALALTLLLAPTATDDAHAAAGDVLQLSSTAYATRGEKTTLVITWVHQGKPVSGYVNLQRQRNGVWEHVRKIEVVDGRATTVITPGATNSYRLRTSAVTSPGGVPQAHPDGTSNTVKVTVVSSAKESAAPDLLAPPVAIAGSSVPFTISWTVGGQRASGKVNLQRRDGNSWVHVKQVTVTNGRGEIAIKVDKTAQYRLRVSTVTSHSGVVTKDPYGTSGTLRVVATSATPSTFRVQGAGWGHGVGLSQYGAYGMALDGSSARQIIQHYYSGADVAYRDTSAEVRVQVLAGASSTTLRTSGGQSRIRLGGSIVATLPAGTSITVTPVSSGLQVQANGQTWRTASTSNRVHVEWAATRYFQPGSTISVNTSVSGAQGVYRHGRLELMSINGRVNAVNVVRVTDEYMYGIAEMPSSWSAAALQAQAIAARSYAMATKPASPRTACDCHLYDDTRSQNYTGWLKENERTYGVRWRDAVDATINGSGLGGVVVSGSSIVQAYYFSSSGGRTQNSEDVWTAALPYLRSVDDRWSLHSRNPNSSWTANVSQSAMRSAFGLPDVARVVVSSRSDGNAAQRVTAYSSDGRTATITGEQLRSRLGLKSTWISSIS